MVAPYVKAGWIVTPFGMTILHLKVNYDPTLFSYREWVWQMQEAEYAVFTAKTTDAIP